MPLLPGERLQNRYHIVHLLRQGPYGAVYRVWDEKDRADRALKEYRNHSPEVQRRFRAEARRLSRLEHPRLPRVLDHFYLEDSGHYLVSVYIDGVDGQQLLDQYGPLPEDLIVPWLQAACDPLAYLHEQDQWHLNLKPANLRLTPAGDVFLVDSGLPGLGVPPGASGFAAPEQQKQLPVDARSDIYSLGATLYTLLTGQPPADALRRESGLVDLKPAREVNPNIAPYLSLVAARAMDLRPDVRYESAADFAAALHRPAGHVPAGVAPTGRFGPRRSASDWAAPAPPPKPSPSRRRAIEQRTLVGLVGVLLVLLGLLGGFALANRPSTLPGGSEVAATATFQSQVIAAITAISTPPSPTPTATPFPTATPQPIVNETGSRMLFVPGGVFRMGNDDGERNEQPSHLLRLDPYFIDETEVTNGEYAQCVAAGVCDRPDSAGASYHPAYYGSAAYDGYPVIFVNWFDAEAFCAWRGARLPTEAEWERAAGFDPAAFERHLYPWGDAFVGEFLNYCDANCPQEWRDTQFDDGHRDTAPVGSYPDGRSPIGAADMLGNVAEWVADWYGFNYYAESIDLNPRGPLEGDARVIRGGSWFSRNDITITTRSSFVPTVSRANLGFRCALDAP